jgi:hypothetical protein
MDPNLVLKLGALKELYKANHINETVYNAMQTSLLSNYLNPPSITSSSPLLSPIEKSANNILPFSTPIFASKKLNLSPAETVVANKAPIFELVVNIEEPKAGFPPSDIKTLLDGELLPDKTIVQKEPTLEEVLAEVDTNRLNASIDCEGNIGADENRNTSFIQEPSEDKEVVEHITSTLADISIETEDKFGSNELKPIEEMTSDEIWSILLLVDIPEGDYFPPPKKMQEIQREPFPLPRELVNKAVC